MAEFKVVIKGDKKIAARFKRISKEMKGQIMFKAMSRSVAKVEGDAKRAAPIGADSFLRNSITHQVERTPEGLSGRVGTQAHYARYVEEGTGPQHEPEPRQKYFPPPSAFERWVRLKLGVTENVKGVAFLIARKISQVGTKPQPFLIPSLNNNRAFISRTIRNAVEQIIGKR